MAIHLVKFYHIFKDNVIGIIKIVDKFILFLLTKLFSLLLWDIITTYLKLLPTEMGGALVFIIFNLEGRGRIFYPKVFLGKHQKRMVYPRTDFETGVW